jgi:CheY-like chemotaxis protein/HPt (histidine-containing phosphotransfer) domain-containing protein
MTTRVLIVDDDPIAAGILEDALRSGGFDVVRSYRADDAMRKMRLHKPDIVLTDLEMPVINGVELISMIREDPELREMPILAVSGYTWEPIAKAAAQYGCDGQIAKPFSPSEVMEKVRECLAARVPVSARVPQGMERPVKSALPAAAPSPPERPSDDRPSSPEPAFDRTAFLGFVDEDLDLARRSIKLLLGNLPVRVEEIRQAVVNGDREALRTSTHTLKGAAAFFAAPVVLDVLLRLEAMARSGHLAGAGAAYFELERALARLKDALDEFVGELAAGDVRPSPGAHPAAPVDLVAYR